MQIWGDEPIDTNKANTWQGEFPVRNKVSDGFATTAPVKSFAPNGYGLYEMGGNVWEWCRDRYDARAYQRRIQSIEPLTVIENPIGPVRTIDPRNPHAPDTRVQRIAQIPG